MIPPRFLRRLLSGGTEVVRERARAIELVDREALAALTNADRDRFREVRDRVRRQDHVVLGETNDGPYLASVPDLLRAHALFSGSSGSGKTFMVTGLLWQLLTRVPRRDQDGIALIVFDMKGETTDILLRLLSRIAANDPSFTRERLHVLRVFHGRHLVPWQLLAADPSVSPIAQAQSIAETIEATVRVATGIRQTGALGAVLLLAIEFGWNGLELLYYIHAPKLLAEKAKLSRFPRQRAYFRDRFAREASVTIDGISARLGVLFGSDELRAMFSARTAAPLLDAFKPGHVTLIDASGAPLGSRELSRAMGALFFERLSWCVFDPNRPLDADVLIVGDEIQEAATERVLGAIERIETLGRSFRTHLWTIHQTTEQLPRELLNILSTNISLRVAGRASQRDLVELNEFLPATSQVRRTRGPFEPPARAPEFLSVADEQRAAGDRLRRLERQHFLVADRRQPFAARFLRAPDLLIPTPDEIPAALEEALARGAWGIDRDALLTHAQEVEERAAARVEAEGSKAGDDEPRRDRGRSRSRSRTDDLPDALPDWSRRGRGRGEVP